jgi:arylsulfatase A-like enzyme/HEAT repeat protein
MTVARDNAGVLGRAISERAAVAPSFGAVAGGIGALVAAAGDLVAMWSEVPDADRAILSLRLVLTLVPPGIVLGALLGLLAYGALRLEAFATRRWASEPKAGRRYFGLPFAFVSAPVAAWVGMELFRGGSMRALPGKDALAIVAALILVALVYAGVRVLRAALTRFGGRTLFATLGFALLYLAAAQIDQRVMPNLYGYLHACLAFFAWLAASLAALVLLVRWPAFSGWLVRGPRSIAPAPAAAIVVLALHFATLDTHPNVRVALFDPRAATSRSFMLTLEPMMGLIAPSGASADAIARAENARALRRSRIAVGELPEWEGPHVLLVTIDALRADHLGLYGYERPVSPHLDALAERAVVFERAYAQAPHSSYSLSSLMTGHYLREAVELDAPLPEPTLPSTLAEHGYETVSFFTPGIFHTEGERLAQYDRTSFGFGSHDPTDDDAAPKTDAVLREADLVRARGEPPTFFWVHYFDTHEPYGDTRYGTGDMDRYDGEISNVDQELDRLITALGEKLERELVIVISADHGEEFREHGGVYHGSSVFDEQVRVPLLVLAPDLPARRVRAPVELVDVAPTILSMVGAEVPATMTGDDLRALMLGRVEDVGPAFSSVTHKKMVVRWPYKLIADFRFNLFQIFDLENDPRERENLAGRETALLDELKGEVYAWLDALGRPVETASRDPFQWAIDTGRLDDRRALAVLEALIASPSAPSERRIEAAALLGQLNSRNSRAAVFSAIDDPDANVRAAAVIALGRLYDDRARERLVPLLSHDDPVVRARAAVSLGRLRDVRAVDALLEALETAPDRYEREEAIRWLGRLRDPRATEPLIDLLDDERIRNITVNALGDLGDRSAFDALVEIIDDEENASVRDGTVRAFGLLDDARALPILIGLANDEPGLRYTGESLVRLGAIEARAIGGVDFRPGLGGAHGLASCVAGPIRHDWNYRERTQCATNAERVSFRLTPSPARGPHVLLLRAKRADAPQPVRFTLTVGRRTLELQADGEWAEQRLELESGDVVEARIEIAEPGATLGLDHLLLIPRASE